MPTSATGNDRGFTLVEMLVVLVIIGLLSSVVVLTVPMGSASLRDDARVLAARLKLASQESVMKGAATGALISPEGYAFYRLQNGKWIEVTDERAFARQVWRKGVAVETLRAANAPSVSASRDKKAVVPNVVFDPTGMTTPFSISLAAQGERWSVTDTANGEVVVRDAR
jgi:general secretion pathway protein H